ncbi:hypothetical protein BaRGS_00028500, partial [Batillaria attramentaria]
ARKKMSGHQESSTLPPATDSPSQAAAPNSASRNHRDLIPLRTKEDVENLLQGIHMNFIDKIEIHESGLMDELISLGVASDPDNDSLDPRARPKRRDRARRLWHILLRINHEKFITLVLPVLCEKIGFIIPQQFWKPPGETTDGTNKGQVNDIEHPCTYCEIKGRVRAEDMADFLFQQTIIDANSYREFTRDGRGRTEWDWDSMFKMFVNVSRQKAADIEPHLKKMLKDHGLHIPDNLVDKTTSGFQCSCGSKKRRTARRLMPSLRRWRYALSATSESSLIPASDYSSDGSVRSSDSQLTAFGEPDHLKKFKHRSPSKKRPSLLVAVASGLFERSLSGKDCEDSDLTGTELSGSLADAKVTLQPYAKDTGFPDGQEKRVDAGEHTEYSADQIDAETLKASVKSPTVYSNTFPRTYSTASRSDRQQRQDGTYLEPKITHSPSESEPPLSSSSSNSRPSDSAEVEDTMKVLETVLDQHGSNLKEVSEITEHKKSTEQESSYTPHQPTSMSNDTENAASQRPLHQRAESYDEEAHVPGMSAGSTRLGNETSADPSHVQSGAGVNDESNAEDELHAASQNNDQDVLHQFVAQRVHTSAVLSSLLHKVNPDVRRELTPLVSVCSQLEDDYSGIRELVRSGSTDSFRQDCKDISELCKELIDRGRTFTMCGIILNTLNTMSTEHTHEDARQAASDTFVRIEEIMNEVSQKLANIDGSYESTDLMKTLVALIEKFLNRFDSDPAGTN